MTGGVFSKTEMSEVLTEVVRMDPTFDKEEFIKLCRFDIIPNILEVTEYFSIIKMILNSRSKCGKIVKHYEQLVKFASQRIFRD